MASPYSQIQQVRKPIQTINTQLFGQVVAKKQENFSKNEALVNQTIAEISKIDLLRDEDKSYLNERLKKVVDMVQNTDNIDFTSGSAGARLGTFITQAVDSNVKKHAAITAKKRAFDKEIQELKKKNPDKYLEMNHQDALYEAGFYEYMKGNSADDEMGKLKYTNYTDVEGDSFKRLKLFKETYPDQEIAYIDPETGENRKMKKSKMTEMQIMEHVLGDFKQPEKDQLAIISRASYRAKAAEMSKLQGKEVTKDQAAAEDYKSRIKKIGGDFDNKIIELKAELKKSTGGTKTEIEGYIKQVEAYKAKTLNNLRVGEQNAGNIGATIMMNELAGKYAQGLYTEGYVTEISNENLNYQLKLKKEARLDAEATAKRIKDSKEKELKKPFTKATGLTTDEDLAAYEVLVNTEQEEAVKKYDEVVDKLLEYTLDKEVEKIDVEGQEIYDDVGQKITNPTNTQILTHLTRDSRNEYKLQNPDASDEDILKIKILEKAENLSLLNSDDKAQLAQKSREMKNISERKTKSKQEGIISSIASNATGFYNELMGKNLGEGVEENIVYFKKNGDETKMHQVLTDLQIDTPEKYQKFITGNTEKAKEFRANIALQASSRQDYSRVEFAPGVLGGVGSVRIDPSKIFDQEYNKEYRPTAKDYFGQSYNKVYERVAALSTRSGLGNYVLLDNNDLSRGLDSDTYIKKYRTALGERMADMPGLNTVVVPPDSELGAELTYRLQGSQEYDKDQGFLLNMNKDGSVSVSQEKSEILTKEKLDGEEVEYTKKGKAIVDTIPKDVVNKSALISDIFEGSEDIGKVDLNLTSDDYIAKNISFAPNEKHQKEGLIKTFGNDKSTINLALKDSVLGEVLGDFPQTEDGQKKYQEAKSFAEKAISASKSFQIKLWRTQLEKYSVDEITIKIDYLDKNGVLQEVDTLEPDQTRGSVDHYQKSMVSIMDAAPQVLVAKLIKKAISNYKKGDDKLMDKVKKLL